MTIEKNVMNCYEVADYLGVSLRLIYKQIKKGVIPAVRVGDRYLVSRVALDRWLQGGDGKSS